MDFDPAYIAIQGYSNEVHAYEKGCSLLTVAKYGAEGAAGVAATAAAAVGGTEALDSLGLFDGNEISIGRNVRISPFGNRDANSLSARVPHYHRRIVGPDGNTVPGGGIKWHRPWQQGF